MGHQIMATNEMIWSRTVFKHNCTFPYELEIANNRFNHTVPHGIMMTFIKSSNCTHEYMYIDTKQWQTNTRVLE